MKLFKQLVWMVAGLVILAAPLMAEDVPGLYEAEVPVASQERDVRDEAIKSAMRQVLVRVTGRQTVLTVTPIVEATEQANRYVQQFRYRDRQATRDNDATQVLWVRFDKQAVDRLLRDNQLPVWGRTRPGTLVWLVVDDRHKRQLLSSDSDNQAHAILEEEAAYRGIPVRLPLMDLADRSKVSVSDVWGNFEDNLMQASDRYQPEAVLVGRVFKTYSGGWSARWSLYQQEQRQDWTTSGGVLADAIKPAVNQVADVLAERFTRLDDSAIAGSDITRVRVTGIKGLADYNRVVKYLDSLAMVSEVRVQQLQPGNVTLLLTSRRGSAAINQSISLGHTLRAESQTMPQTGNTPPANPVDLQYQLLP